MYTEDLPLDDGYSELAQREAEAAQLAELPPETSWEEYSLYCESLASSAPF